ncbi:MAG: type I glyceraldehyde-3-phosphate dehydrogenase, partial [Nitriliruptoraceae bacterium]
LDGMALRVPIPDGSVTDLSLVLERDVTAADVNAAMRAAAEGPLRGVLEYCEDPIVSIDIVGNPHSCVFDSLATMASGRLVKVLGWYDNEWGYSCRLAELTALVAARL